MADEFNSMQAQLGLVGQGGSFNPLGIATPAPPPPPQVRHPGDVSSDIVRQTQTQMATTLQTTSAMRLGGMGGMAFGGMSGPGAVGAFAAQYQQNMAGINAQQIAPFSAQMMGVMSGMGGGFSPGMLPHPAMMTTPGMGIYRPFMPPAPPTVSPMPQMPMFQMPFTPMPAASLFQTPMERMNNMAIQAGQVRTAAMFATPGVAARGAADVGLGYMGAGAGAALGARFGPMGAVIGGTLGMAAGVFGSEHFGLGATAQHITDQLNPFRTMAIRGQQMMGASQEFVAGGAGLNMVTGRGLSQQGSTHLARMLEDTAFSTSFRRQTGGAFSAQDLTRITQVAGQQGMLNDTQSVEQIHDRVKTVAKSLVSFMKIANEPNVVEALKSMGKMRQMGLSLGETMDMAVDARMYARMAGTSVRGIMETGGAQGAMLFQQQGLSAGLGMRMGMGAMGMANAAVAGGAFTPQRLAMLGGVQGVAQHEMESSAAFLKMPMMAAAMSTMGRGGEFGMDGRALRQMVSGRMDINQMATLGTNKLLDAVSKQGIGALGMFQVQGTELQDAMGRLLGPQGTQAAKMQQVVQTMKLMGLDMNPGGFATAGLAMGMSNDQVKAMMSQANSPGYFANIQRQMSVQKMDIRGLANEEFERNRPGFFAGVRQRLGGLQGLTEAYEGFRNMGEGISNWWSGRELRSQARERGQVVLDTPDTLLASGAELRNMRGLTRAQIAGASGMLTSLAGTGTNVSSRFGRGYDELRDAITGGNQEDLRQLRESQGGWASVFGGGVLESTYRGFAAGLFGSSGGLGTEFENQAATRDLAQGAGMWATSQREGVDDRKARLARTASRAKVDPAKMRELVASVQMRLADKARSNKNLLLKNGMMGGAEATEIIADEARKAGIVLDKEGLESIGALSGKMAGELSGNQDAFRPRDFVNVKSDKEFKEGLVEQQDALTRAVFGDEGIDLFRGTRNTRGRLLQKMFGEQKDAKAGVLAAMMAAAEMPGASDAAKQQLKAALAGASEEDLDRAAALKGQNKDQLAAMAQVGESFAKIEGSIEDKFRGGEAIRQGTLVGKRAAAERVGKRAMFGEGAGLEGSTEDLLRSGSLESMNPEMRDIAERYRAAQMQGEDTTDIVAEADKLVIGTGVASSSEVAGGFKTVEEAATEANKARMAKTEGDVSAAFPHAVDTFSEASRAMLKAAQMLNRTADRPSLPAGGEFTGGM